jgi:hypothetical protein
MPIIAYLGLSLTPTPKVGVGVDKMAKKEYNNPLVNHSFEEVT